MCCNSKSSKVKKLCPRNVLQLCFLITPNSVFKMCFTFILPNMLSGVPKYWPICQWSATKIGFSFICRFQKVPQALAKFTKQKNRRKSNALNEFIKNYMCNRKEKISNTKTIIKDWRRSILLALWKTQRAFRFIFSL